METNTMKNTGTLTSQEFKTIREELGLTQSELCKLLNIKNYKNIQRWEAGNNAIPQGVCDDLLNILRENHYQIEARLKELSDKYYRYDVAPVYLILKDDPIENAALRKAYIRFIFLKKNAHLLRFDEKDYQDFLTAHNLTDSEYVLNQWADDYFTNRRYMRPVVRERAERNERKHPDLFPWQIALLNDEN